MNDGRPTAMPRAAFRHGWIAAAALLGAILLRSFFYLAWDEAYFDSDQAIVGLMAKHIVEGRAWPLFFYGQEYMLAVESWAAIPLFMLFGPTVFALHSTMVLVNVAAGVLLWRLLVREAGLDSGAAALAVLPFCLAPVVLSAHLIEAQGGNPEPFLWVAILWLARKRPLLLGTLASIAFLHREFTAYAMPSLFMVAVIEHLLRRAPREAWMAEARRWATVAFAGLVVFLSIQALKPAADLMGPGTAGSRAPDRPQDNLTQLANRVEWNSAAIPRRFAKLPTELFPLLLGVSELDPRVFAIGSGVRVGWPELAPLVLVVAVVWPVALLLRRGAAERPAGQWLFPLYLIVVGVQSAVVYAVTRDPSVYLLRYALLALFIPIGVAALLLQPWRAAGVRIGAAAVLVLLAGGSAIDHARVIRRSYESPAPLRFADAAARLDERGIRVGRAGYWRAYAISFLTRERVKLTSTEVLRIQEYEDLADAAEPAVLHVQEQPCRPGIAQERVGAWFLCGP